MQFSYYIIKHIKNNNNKKEIIVVVKLEKANVKLNYIKCKKINIFLPQAGNNV